MEFNNGVQAGLSFEEAKEISRAKGFFMIVLKTGNRLLSFE